MIFVGLLAAAAWHTGLFQLEDRSKLIAAIDRARMLPDLPAYFVATYAVAAAIGVPASPLTLAGGALFGIELGIALNWLGEALAAFLAFGLVRAGGFTFGTRWTRLPEALSGLSAPRARATLLRLRMIPVVPFAMLNVGAAMSGISWRDFTIATLIGIIPITVIYTASASELVAGVAGSGARAFATGLVSAAILIGASFVPALVNRARQSSAAPGR